MESQKKHKYPVSSCDLTGNEKKYLNLAIDENMISSKGRFVGEFEKKFAEWNRVKYGVACSSGTTALTLALASLKIGAGDEVIVPEFTMIATAWAVSYLGATPVFVDCSWDLNIDVSKIEEKITSRTKAIMPVHIYGRQCNMGEIKRIAYEHNLRIVEDSCEAHGIKPEGDIACFSLFGNKIITSGEGGICLTNDKHLAEQMEHLRSMAFNSEHSFLHSKLAYNFRRTNLQAAVALAQTERLNKIIKKRKQIEGWYDEELQEIKEITVMPKRKVLWMYDILAENREGLMDYLTQEGIESRLFFKPMSMQPMYKGEYKNLDAYSYSKIGLYLPTYNALEKSDVRLISSKVKEFYGEK